MKAEGVAAERVLLVLSLLPMHETLSSVHHTQRE